MIRQTILEALLLLLVALAIALLHHALASTGITIFKKRPSAPQAISAPHIFGGTMHGA